MDFKQNKNRGKGIVHVSHLFYKYTKTLKAPQGIVVTAFIHVVEEVCGVTLTKTQCKYDVAKKTVSVLASGVVKTEILLKKEEILHSIQDVLGRENSPTQIL